MPSSAATAGKAGTAAADVRQLGAAPPCLRAVVLRSMHCCQMLPGAWIPLLLLGVLLLLLLSGGMALGCCAVCLLYDVELQQTSTCNRSGQEPISDETAQRQAAEKAELSKHEPERER